ncbi:MAG: RNA chaperone Hfq [Firmicutes bacterium]|nr:RNA chaperone Hfq [Bacillota bacterium]
MNRKLIRPDFGEIKDRMGRGPKNPTPADSPSVTTLPLEGAREGDPSVPQGTGSPRRKIAPPEQTNAESFYYLKQMQSKTPMVIVLQNDEKLRGVIEWYDKHCLKINRIKEPNLLVPKHNIKYIYKQDEEPRIRRSRSSKKGDSDAPDVELPPYD